MVRIHAREPQDAYKLRAPVLLTVFGILTVPMYAQHAAGVPVHAALQRAGKTGRQAFKEAFMSPARQQSSPSSPVDSSRSLTEGSGMGCQPKIGVLAYLACVICVNAEHVLCLIAPWSGVLWPRFWTT